MFPYDTFSPDLQNVLRGAAGDIQKILRRRAADVIEIGRQLALVQDRLDALSFKAWLAAEFAWSQRTAANYIAVARRFQHVESLARFHLAALYFLARDAAPQEAVVEAVGRATAGETITLKTAEEIVSRHRGPSPQAAPPPAGPVNARRELSRLRRYVRNLASKCGDLGLDRQLLAQELTALAREIAPGQDSSPTPADASPLETTSRQSPRGPKPHRRPPRRRAAPAPSASPGATLAANAAPETVSGPARPAQPAPEIVSGPSRAAHPAPETVSGPSAAPPPGPEMLSKSPPPPLPSPPAAADVKEQKTVSARPIPAIPPLIGAPPGGPPLARPAASAGWNSPV
jgi:hypothetical protein